MIDYETGVWHLALICKLRGSVFPIAFTWAVPSAMFSYAIAHYCNILEKEAPLGMLEDLSSRVNSLWSAYTFIVGFLVVFRTQQAYGRYWEGATLLRQARAEWFHAYSSLIAFSAGARDKKLQVEAFQHQVVRLMSMLNCVALQTITDMADDDFVTLDTQGIDPTHLAFLASKEDPNQRLEILLQWIQRLVVDNMEAGILPIPPPILTRFFQELSKGAVSLSQARNMTEIPFPFPYAQMLTLLLVLNCVMTSVISALVLRNGFWSAWFTFVLVFAFWGANYIAAEIESPFGDDANDLPLNQMQEDVNASLWTLLEQQAQKPPQFHFDSNTHRSFITRRGSFSLPNGQEERTNHDCRLKSRTTRTNGSEKQLRTSMESWSLFYVSKNQKSYKKPGYASKQPHIVTARLEEAPKKHEVERRSMASSSMMSQPLASMANQYSCPAGETWEAKSNGSGESTTKAAAEASYAGRQSSDDTEWSDTESMPSGNGNSSARHSRGYKLPDEPSPHPPRPASSVRLAEPHLRTIDDSLIDVDEVGLAPPPAGGCDGWWDGREAVDLSPSRGAARRPPAVGATSSSSRGSSPEVPSRTLASPREGKEGNEDVFLSPSTTPSSRAPGEGGEGSEGHRQSTPAGGGSSRGTRRGPRHLGATQQQGQSGCSAPGDSELGPPPNLSQAVLVQSPL